MKKHYKLSKGFTLVEILASVIVLFAVGSIIAGIISSSLRGANKTNTIENLRQNGNYALNQISKDIQYAQSFDGETTGFSNNNGETYSIFCPVSPGPTPVPFLTTYKLISIQSANGIRKYFCDSRELLVDGNSLIDLSQIKILDCSFTCIQSKSTDVPIIKIKFELAPSNTNGLVENSGSIVFETSVTLRNYGK
jgi:type II secretory pathway pseudopilin PulG